MRQVVQDDLCIITIGLVLCDLILTIVFRKLFCEILQRGEQLSCSTIVPDYLVKWPNEGIHQNRLLVANENNNPWPNASNPPCSS